jgi:LysR family positive regulator for ilvC
VLQSTDLTFIAPRHPGELSSALNAKPPNFAQLPFIVPIAGLERQRLESWLRQRNIAPRIVAEVRGNEGIIAMVGLGCGVALVPKLVLENSPLKDNVQVLCGVKPPPGYDVSLCALPRSLKRRVVEVFWGLAGEIPSSQ